MQRFLSSSSQLHADFSSRHLSVSYCVCLRHYCWLIGVFFSSVSTHARTIHSLIERKYTCFASRYGTHCHSYTFAYHMAYLHRCVHCSTALCLFSSTHTTSIRSSDYVYSIAKSVLSNRFLLCLWIFPPKITIETKKNELVLAIWWNSISDDRASIGKQKIKLKIQ